MNLLTEHLDIWTAAQTPKTKGGRGRSKNSNGQSQHGIKKLRELILELAVRGKLVPQDPNDEPASVLLEKIAKEKARLIKEGKIKKQKKLPEISEDEKPFGLPTGWEWTRLGGIALAQAGFAFKSKLFNENEEGLPLIRIRDVGQPFSGTYYSGVYREEFLVKNGDYLISMDGQFRVAPWLNDLALLNQRVTRLIFFDESVGQRFVADSLQARLLELQGVKAYTTVDHLSGMQISEAIITLPPLAEQQRIVSKVDELMALCDQLEQQQTDSNTTHQTLLETLLATLTNAADQEEFAKAWQRIANHFDTLFTTEQSIDQLKQTILQLAVMGKLVPQNPDDEPASVLLEKIAKEKARLVKEGKIKRQKLLLPINVNDTPFELPQGWAWARFPEVGEFGRGKSKHRPRNDPSLYLGGKYPMVQTGDVARANGVVETFTALYNDKGLSQSRLWPKGTMCITIAANIADSSILGFDACFPDSVVGLIPSNEIGDAKYFEYFLRTAKEYLMDFAPSTAQKNINLGILETVYIPLPPVEEIKRIVSKVNVLMVLCDTLKVRLTDAQTTQVQLADAIVE